MEEIKQAKLSDLIQDDRNLNKGTERGQQLIEKSLREFGAGRSLLLDKNNRIIAGNKTHRNAEAIGMDDVIIVETDGTKLVAVKRTDVDLDSKQGREMALADNATVKVDLAWDTEELESVAEDFDIALDEWDVELDGEVLDLNDAQEDDFDEEKDEIKTVAQRGDVFLLGEHRLMCGDSTSDDDVAKLMNGEMAELLFTSPPYSDMRAYNGDKDLSIVSLAKFIPTYEHYAEYQCVNLGLQIKNGEIVQYWDAYIASARDCGYKLMAWNVWDKLTTGAICNQTHYITPMRHEWIFVFGKAWKDINRTWEKKTESIIEGNVYKKKRSNDDSFKYSTTGDHSNPYKKMESVLPLMSERGKIRSEHPAVFPIRLPAEYIAAFTNEDDIVIEPFGGSGTTMIAAEQLCRKCYMMELDTHYCDVIIARWEKLTGKKAVKINNAK